MLSSLLFSSTAVKADTADDVEQTSTTNEVVIETGNTSNDTNSSTNQNDTVSGRDSIDTNSTTTTENDNVNPGDDSDNDDEQECQHQWKTVTVSVGNGRHKTYEECELCEEVQNITFENCVMAAEGRTYENIDHNNDEHKVIGHCDVCGAEMTAKEKCEFTVGEDNHKYCSREACENERDIRKTEPVISVSYVDEEGNAITPSESMYNDKNEEFLTFDQRVKVIVKVYCEILDDEASEDWLSFMNVNLTAYNGDSKMNIPPLTCTAFDDCTKTATYEWISEENPNTVTTVSKVKASYSVLKKNRWGFRNPLCFWNYHSGNSEQNIRYIVRNIPVQTQIDNIRNTSITGGPWTMDDSHIWYSNAIKNHPDTLTAVFEGMSINKITDITLEEINSTNKVKLTTSDPVQKPVWNRNGTAFIGWNNVITFSIPTNVEDVHEYSLAGKLLNTDVNSKNSIKTYIDNTAPKATVEYISDAKVANEKYYNKDVTVTVNADEKHIDTANSIVNVSNHNNTNGEGKFAEGSNTTSIVVGDESAHVVSGTIYDLAGNSFEIEGESEFIVDKTAPVLTIKFDNNEFKHDKYFKADRTATFTLTDVNIDSKEADMSKVTVNAKGGKHTVNQMSGSNGSYTGSIVFDQDGTYSIGAIDFKDKAGNEWVASSDMQEDYNKEFVIDKTAPVVTVEFDNNSFLNGMYYKDARVATINFKELNFTNNQVSIKKNSGEELAVPKFSAYTDKDDNHITKISFDKDGKYGFTLSCEDMAGNMSNTYVSDDFVIDMTAPELEISGVTDMSANNGKVVPFIKSKDDNLTDACTEITLSGSNNGTINPSISKTKGTGLFTYEIADIAHEKANDDLYTLNVKLTDLAGNKVEKTYKYSLNRFGSIFVLSDATKAMVDNYYVTSPQDVVITEINVDSLTSKEVSVAHDGNVKNVAEGRGYQVSDLTNNKGWHSISYTVNASNFKKDGMYSVTVFSEDKATNKQSNQSKDAEVKFLMDATAPSVVVSGLDDEGVYEEASHDFSVNAADTMGVEKMSVLLNGDKLGEYSAKELSENGGTVVLTIPSKDDYQKVEIICSDVAGNKTNLVYNNILVSEKAEELLISDNLTPTTGDNDAKAAVGTSVINNISKVIAIVGIIVAIVMIGAVVVITNRKKANN